MNGAFTFKSIKHHERVLSKKLQLIVQICSYATQSPRNAFEHPPSSLHCGTLLQLFTNTKSLRKGQQLHAYVISSGILLDNTYLKSKLSAFYAICGCMNEARVIFDQIVLKNSFLWNSMIRGYACSGFSIDSILLYRQMLSFGQKADNFTYPFVLKACGDILLVEVGKKIHCEIVICGFDSNIYVGNSLLFMYTKFGDMSSAERLFDRMPMRDSTSWNTIISGYAMNFDPHKALSIFNFMGESGIKADCTTLLSILSACSDLAAVKQGKEIHGYILRNGIAHPNNFLTNSLIDLYCKCNSILVAGRLFEELSWRDTVSWNSMISGHAQHGDAVESLRIFCRMVAENADPDHFTLVAVLGACDQIAALQFGKSVHACVVQKGFGRNTIVGTALVDMYAKCGVLFCSRRMFDELPNKNLVSWSAMAAGFGLHGKGREAIEAFHEMKANGVRPDEITFTSVLSACSHAGLVDEGCKIFHMMRNEYHMKPGLDHYSCMVDLLGRAGQLDEAYDFIKAMEVTPTVDIWASFLSACRVHDNIKLAEIAARAILDMNPRNVGPYICLANIYAMTKRWDDVEWIRALVRSEGLKKSPGCSFM